MITRRTILLGGGALLVLAAAGGTAYYRVEAKSDGSFEVTHTEAEWRALLSDAQYAVLRKEETERPFTSPLNDEKRDGVFHCAGCDLPLYPSETKFDSGTGWPSFYAPLENAVETKQDFSLLLPRTEVHCRRCGGHLGHIFNDGPPPTGKRHCLNGVALTFVPA
ncbi:peptide-methionine (R)-S-oxide reductase MsrB [Breoghania sp. L-A4]|uniref:peptide-methionine (R)-S-oxide reductase MsrB n=1 Tax=Breoghania sp. L-A4 TaxID=2304600 RepID=UPI000E35D82E|nr:peptide-methionine (R)-S-oxide reductase MsrB [Breoghania sp. L-A4]AXS41023.1 peptide-methionine (R)-S-oxide reductase [Breoghania sp. L-A4]